MTLQQNKEPLQAKLENKGDTNPQTGKESKPASLADNGAEAVSDKNTATADKNAQAKQEAVSPVEDVPTPAGSEKAGGKETGQAQGDSKGGSKSEGGGDFFGTVRSGIHNNLMTLGLINLKKLGMQILAAGAAKITGAIRKMLTPKVKFKLGSETHELWVEKGENRNVVMMASGKGEPFGDQLKRRNIPNDVEVIRDQKEAEAPENEKIAEPKVRNLAETTETVTSGDKDKDRSKVGSKTEKHHIATDKSKKFDFKNHPAFKETGIDVSKDIDNLVDLVNHRGRHTDTYHMEVQRRLDAVYDRFGGTDKLEGVVRSELNAMKQELLDGTLNPYGK